MSSVNETDLKPIIASIAEKVLGVHVTQKQADQIFDGIQDALIEQFKLGNDVKQHDFGRLSVVERAARKGTSFGKSYDNPAYKTVVFKAYSKLKESLNG